MEERKFEDEPNTIPTGTRFVNNKYTVMHKLSTEGTAVVYSIVALRADKKIRAMKVENEHIKESQIKAETHVLTAINRKNEERPRQPLFQGGFTTLYESGCEKGYNYMIMSLEGPNLSQLLRLCGGSFSLRTTLLIGLQIIDRLEAIHELGYIYCDIRPQNFLIGLEDESNLIFMVDFGRSKQYRRGSQHIPYKESSKVHLNPIFSSVHMHNHVQLSRRDDLESLIYLLAFIHNGKLPWVKSQESSRSNRKQFNLEDIKRKATPETICYKMPIQIVDLIYYVRSLEFYERPDYDLFRKNLWRCVEREKMDVQYLYDWNQLETVNYSMYVGTPNIVLESTEERRERIYKEHQEQSRQLEEIEEIREESQLIDKSEIM